MKYEKFNDVFKDMDQVFKDMDQVMKIMEKKMEEVMMSADAANPEPWQKWFAWHPVIINNKRQWMKTVYRRTRLKFGDQSLIHEWEYTDMFGVLKDAGK